jgi:hypothetical protein
MSNRILVVTAQGEVRYLGSESEAVRVLTIQPTGARGAAGATGAGVATGGSANDILKKTSATNYATAWETPTSAATANTIVRRDASGGAAFDDLTAATVVFTGFIQSTAASAPISTTGDGSPIVTDGNGSAMGTSGQGSTISTAGNDSPISTFGATSSIRTFAADSNIETLHASASVRSYNFAPLDEFAGASLRNNAGTAILTWGATAGNISITVNTTSTGHFFSNPSTSEAGHFLTKNGTTPTLAAGRSAWFSSTTGAPQFKNGTGSAVTLLYDGGALGTPLTGTLTNCTGLPVTTGVSGLGTNVAAFLATPTSANLAAALTDETGSGAAMFGTNPTLTGYTEATVAIGNSGTAKTISLANGTFQTVTLTGNCTFTMPTATAGQSFILKILTGAGGFTGTFTSVKWPGGTAPTITTTASKFDLASFIADGSAWTGSIIQNYTA